MRVDLFDYDLPLGLIATRPLETREDARLLVVGETNDDHYFGELPDLLRPGDLLVCNDTQVIPALLIGRKGTARISVNLHHHRGLSTWDAFVKPARKLAVGDEIEFAPVFTATVQIKGEGGEVTLKFNVGGEALRRSIERYGAMPLPPYITRARPPDAQDRTDYQTMFARSPGAVAAPTAGLHFTERLMRRLQEHEIGWVPVTLHVGAGTFLPLRVKDTSEHEMHPELGIISPGAAKHINEAKARGSRIVAVGTTSLRLLEAATDENGTVHAGEGETRLFIQPGYRFKTVDVLITNFHLPRSTLFMLVCAFSGIDRMKNAYEHAIQHGYRFYSYGDAALLTRAEG
jgi:S-adenosylmethionine:tRNA ribosyltransferase-isomerase